MHTFSKKSFFDVFDHCRLKFFSQSRDSSISVTFLDMYLTASLLLILEKEAKVLRYLTGCSGSSCRAFHERRVFIFHRPLLSAGSESAVKYFLVLALAICTRSLSGEGLCIELPATHVKKKRVEQNDIMSSLPARGLLTFGMLKRFALFFLGCEVLGWCKKTS